MNYTKIFDLFVKKDPIPMNDWMTKPFINETDGNVWATDGAAAVIVAMDVAGLQYDKLEKKLAMPCELPTEKHIHLLSDQIREAVEKCPKDEIMEEKEVKCKECDGTGKVLWEYSASTKFESYDHEYDCPVCDGDGSIYEEVGTGRYEPAKKSGVRIGEAVFSAWQLDRILKAMDIIGVCTIDIISEPHRSKATMFRIDNHIKVLQMPMFADDLKDIVNIPQ